MSDATVVDTIRKIRLFDGLDEHEIARLASMAQIEEFPSGIVVFQAGQQAKKFYVVLEGSVSLEFAVSDSPGKRVHTLGEGELLGWSPILYQSVMRATGRTLKPSKLIAFDSNQALELCQSDPKFGYLLMRQIARALAERLTATRRYLLEVCRHDLPDVAPFGVQEGAD